MALMTRNFLKTIFFLSLFALPIFSLCPVYKSDNRLKSVIARYKILKVLQYKIKVASVSVEISDEDYEEFISELWFIFSNSYKNIVELTAMYLSGYDKVSDKLLIDISQNLLNLSKTLTTYCAKVFKDPRLKWADKVKKCLVVTVVMVVIRSWIKEISKLVLKNEQPY